MQEPIAFFLSDESSTTKNRILSKYTMPVQCFLDLHDREQQCLPDLVFLQFLLDNTIYYARRKARDDAARAAFFAELERDDMDGIYIRDLIRGEVKADDPRLR